MISVLGPLPWLVVRQLHGSPFWLVLEDYVFALRVNGTLIKVGVPAGYRYNRASIPDALSWIVSKDDCGCLGPLLHDVLYNGEGELLGAWNPAGWEPSCVPWRRWTREEADEAFLAVMIEDKVLPGKARVAYWAVRLVARRW